MKNISKTASLAIATINEFRYNTDGKTLKLVNNMGNVLNIKFKKDSFFNFIRIDDKIKNKKGKKIEEYNKILKMLYRGNFDFLSKEDKKDIKEGCLKYFIINDTNALNIQSIINYNNKIFVVKEYNENYYVLELKEIKKERKYNRKTYNIKDVLTIDNLNSVINNYDSFVTFPIRSCTYVDENKTKNNFKKLPNEIIQKRIEDFKDFIYFDSNGNVREQNADLNASEFVKRVPTRK